MGLYWGKVAKRAANEAAVAVFTSRERGVISFLLQIVVGLLLYLALGEAGVDPEVRIASAFAPLLLYPVVFLGKMFSVPAAIYEGQRREEDDERRDVDLRSGAGRRQRNKQEQSCADRGPRVVVGDRAEDDDEPDDGIHGHAIGFTERRLRPEGDEPARRAPTSSLARGARREARFEAGVPLAQLTFRKPPARRVIGWRQRRRRVRSVTGLAGLAQEKGLQALACSPSVTPGPGPLARLARRRDYLRSWPVDTARAGAVAGVPVSTSRAVVACTLPAGSLNCTPPT